MSSRKKRNQPDAASWWRSPRLAGLLHVALAVYAAIALAGPSAAWWSLAQGEAGTGPVPPGNPGGPVGALAALAVRAALGDLWCWALPALLAVRGLGLLLRGEASRLFLGSRLVPLWLASAVWLGQSGWPLATPQAAAWGGVTGYGLARGFGALFGRAGAGIFLSFLLLTAVMRATHPWLPALLGRLGPWGVAVGSGLAAVWRALVWVLLLPSTTMLPPGNAPSITASSKKDPGCCCHTVSRVSLNVSISRNTSHQLNRRQKSPAVVGSGIRWAPKASR